MAHKEDQAALLCKTALHGDSIVLENLVSKGADINAKNEIGWSPLHNAVIPSIPYGNPGAKLHLVEYLLNNGADVNSRGKKCDWTPLLRTVWYSTMDVDSKNMEGFKAIIECLLKHEADANAKESVQKTTSLHIAAKHGKIEIVECLIKYGANINVKDENNRTPLYTAAEFGELNIVECLLKYGADPNIMSKVVPAYLDLSDGLTPLHVAASLDSGKYHRKIDIIECLLKSGADVNATSSRYSNTPLHVTVVSGNIDHDECLSENVKDSIACLSKYGVDIDSKNKTGKTPLHMVALFVIGEKSIGKDIAECLLNHGAQLHAKDNDGKTPLEFALQCDDNQEIIDFLRNYNNENSSVETHYADNITKFEPDCITNTKEEFVEIDIKEGNHNQRIVDPLNNRKSNGTPPGPLPGSLPIGSTSPNSSSQRSKRKRRSFDLQLKLKAIELVENGCFQREVARDLGIDESLIRSWMGQKNKIREACHKSGKDQKRLKLNDDQNMIINETIENLKQQNQEFEKKVEENDRIENKSQKYLRLNLELQQKLRTEETEKVQLKQQNQELKQKIVKERNELQKKYLEYEQLNLELQLKLDILKSELDLKLSDEKREKQEYEQLNLKLEQELDATKQKLCMEKSENVVLKQKNQELERRIKMLHNADIVSEFGQDCNINIKKECIKTEIKEEIND